MDQGSSVITGVSVLTIGEARGHGEFVDAVSLQQFLDCAREYTDGIKVKADHGGGVMTIVGRLRNFRIDANKLRGDLHLLKSARDRELILEMATEMPEDFGLSPTFLGDAEIIDGQYRTRCSEILSIDLVDMPASNPTGLYGRKLDNTENDMETEQITKIAAEAVAEAIAPVMEQVEEMRAAIEEQRAQYEADKAAMEADKSEMSEDEKEMSEDEKAAMQAKKEEMQRTEMAAVIASTVKAELKAFASKLGVARPVATQAKEEVKDTPKTFAAIVAEIQTERKLGKLEALTAAIKENPTAYAEARDKGQLNTI